MAKIITIANRKGGVAKTTTTVNLGAILQEKGYKVLFVDLDNQADTSKTLRADLRAKGSYEILANKEKAIDVIQVINDKYNLITASADLINTDTVLKQSENILGYQNRLKNSLKSVDQYFDFIVIDTPPTLNTITDNAFMCTDYLVIPCNATVYSIDGAIALFNKVKEIKENGNDNLIIGGILLTDYNTRTVIAKDIKENFEEITSVKGCKVFETKIRHCTALQESQAYNMPICDYNTKNNGYVDYMALADEILRDLGKETTNNG